jgi:hypothetical protein
LHCVFEEIWRDDSCCRLSRPVINWSTTPKSVCQIRFPSEAPSFTRILRAPRFFNAQTAPSSVNTRTRLPNDCDPPERVAQSCFARRSPARAANRPSHEDRRNKQRSIGRRDVRTA